MLFIALFHFSVAGLEDCDSRHTMKQKRKNCEKCYKQIGNEEKLCEQCVITIEKDILDINERDNIGKTQIFVC